MRKRLQEDRREPIRDELLGPDRLIELAERIGRDTRLAAHRRRRPRLLVRLTQNRARLRRVRDDLHAALLAGDAISPAAEWLVDNFHLLEEQFIEVIVGLPRGYYRSLPKLADDDPHPGRTEAGMPRVVALASAYVAHTDSRFDPALFRSFIMAVQRGSVLEIGELWAAAISLRVVLLENLRRLADSIVERRAARQAADAVADRVLGLPSGGPLPRAAAEALLRQGADKHSDSAFLVQLFQRLREEDAGSSAGLDWLLRELLERGAAPDALVEAEHQLQAANQVTVANAVTSLRNIAKLDWPKWVESVSIPDEILRRDPAGVYQAQDFASRDQMRHALEALARGSRRLETDVAEAAISQGARYVAERANEGGGPPETDAGTPIAAVHVGYWLLGGGRRHLERELGYRAGVRETVERMVRAAGLWGYLGAAAALATVPAVALAWMLWTRGSPLGFAVGLALLALFPLGDAAFALVNRAVLRVVPPRSLPKLEFEEGIPAVHATVVAVPTLLTNEEEIAEQVDRLEVHYLANSEAQVWYVLAGDFADADHETEPGDAALLASATEAIARLNARHGGGSLEEAAATPPRFLLLHRRRLWNPSQGKWMGWERKRGKLEELNHWLTGDEGTTFQTPPQPWLRGVRFVVTLDADTRLPRGALRKMVGCLAHPLHRPRIDPATRTVTSGYGILQPRVVPMLPERGRGSLYQRIFSGPTGVDPYVAAVSDVYQDLFEEGSYTGKGIYDLAAFTEALRGRTPQNRLLSHDLFEGSFARAGLATDILVFEEFPANYAVAAARQHRWTRGDWQLLPWLLSARVPGTAGGGATGEVQRAEGAPVRVANPLSVLSRWKMFDNLRRSLSPIATLLLLAGGWLAAPVEPDWWLAAIAALLALPPSLSVLSSFLPRRHAAAERADPGGLVAEAGIAAAQSVLALALLPARAHLRADAIVRTLWRLAVRRRLLEWVTAAQARAGATLGWGGFFVRMASSPLCAAALVASCQMLRPERMPVVLPVALLWLLAPAIARALSVPRLQPQELPLAAEDARYLRLVARRTWRYFEDFAGASYLYLPADNFQDDPVPAVAARTSPTNIGLGLLASVIAHDFGWISGTGLADRLEGAFDTMERLERFHGHFLNWYALDSGRSLEPRYVSTVDSGNLAAALLAVAAACREAARSEAPPGSKAAAGEADALMLARAAVAAKDLDEERLWFEAAARTAESWHRERMLAGDAEGWQRQSRQFATLARRAESFAAAMDFRLLYDPNRELLSTGMRLPDGQLDESHYDLLASEARLASFLAIAKGDVPLRHWFHLGRPVAGVAGDAGLLSWSGSMFEYLMPTLLMREPAGSLLERTNRSAVAAHRLFGRRHRVPWGVSESAFNVRDRELIYQYGPFGVPELALKRAVIGDVVVAPYATALAAMVDPAGAIANLRRLEELGALGRYGFREALDFSPARVPAGRSFAMINSWMSHHQGMSLAAFANVLLAGLPRDRFHASAAARSTELLLQERTPRDILTVGPRPAPAPPLRVRATAPTAIRRYSSPHQRTPRVQLLSNGAYSVMMTAAGGGWSRRSGMAVTRWREDATRDCWGSFLYLRDPWSGELWSAGYQPLAKEAAEYEVLLADAKVEIRRRDGTIESRLEVVVSAEDDAELRLLTLVNHGPRERKIEVTSYAEVALVTPAADEAHPAYSNLFVRTEYVHSPTALLAHRRPHGGAEEHVWAAHMLAVAGARDGAMQHETDRARFLGRGRGPERAQVLDGRPLSGTTGPVLDPIFSWRQAVRIPANGKAQLLFTTLVGADRETVMRLAEKYQTVQSYERAAALAWTRAQVELRHLGITADEAHLYQRLASALVYSDPSLRPPPETLRRSRLGQPGLWALGISGDLPIVLLRVEREDDRTLLRQVLRAQSYLRSRGLGADVVVLNEHPSTYSEEVQSALMAVAAAAGAEAPEKGRVFVLRADQISPDTRDLLMAAARVVLVARRGTLAEQLQRVAATVSAPPVTAPRATRLPSPPSPPLSPAPQFWNGLGGFVDRGRVYSIALDTAPQTSQQTPVPWINVIANERFGFQVSESGAGFTWAINSRENKLTPWSNDPVADPAGEVFYVRDADSGALLSPTAAPAVAAGGGPFRCRHGQGWSEFEHAADGLELRLTQLVPFSDPVKISRLAVRNTGARPRRLEAYFFADLVLGVTRSATAPHVVTHLDAATGALFAENRWNPEFADRTAFAWISGEVVGHSADRGEFLGRHGSVERPAALRGGSPLSGRTGAGLDACAALSSAHNLAPGASVEILVLLGQGDDREHARVLVERYRQIEYEAQLTAVKERWESILGALQVESPDPALDLLVNRWLLYQTLSCRLWARSGFYQSSGAYGFRDQLQDAMALSVAHRETPRAQILRAAARQFREGDVQHWWHIPSGRGVRTRCSDDLLWLPLAAIRYAEATGDWTVFGEPVPFLEQPPLGPGVQEEYRQPELSAERATLYEHCARAVDHSVAVGVGAHGLPLMGSGDWNDGMNRVGIGGRGESVWLGWFQCVVLEQMAGLADARREPERAVRWRMRRQEVAAALEKTAWDGAWYRRAFYDDGTPLGSAANRECRIDSIAQSWAVLSGVGDRSRATRAMAAVQEHLVRRGDGLVLLFTPPFEHTVHDPGYIKSYLPGVRENGGQYTHAAIWTVIAYAELGDGDRAGELFSLLNPINHTSTRAGVYRYQGEPYVTAGDIYSEVPHLGRAGWTWYTGSAGWMYRAAVEWILGFRLRGDHLHIDPCIPRHWPRYTITFRYHGGTYRIEVDNPRSVARGVVALELDGTVLDPAAGVPLSGLPGEHLVRVRLGTEPPASAATPANSTSAGAIR